MRLPLIDQVAEYRDPTVQGVEEPVLLDVAGLELDLGRVSLPSRRAEGPLPGHHRREHAAHAGVQEGRRRDPRHGRDVRVAEDRLPGGVADQLRDLERRVAVARLVAEEEAHVRLGPGHLLLVGPVVEVDDAGGATLEAGGGPLRDVGGQVRLVPQADVDRKRALRRGEGRPDVSRGQLHLGFPADGQDGRVGQHRAEPAHDDLAVRQRTRIDFELRDPEMERQRALHRLGEQALVISVQLLQVVLGDEQPFRPNGLANGHCAASVGAALSVPPSGK